MNQDSAIFVYSDKYCCDIGAHVFPVAKYSLLKQKLISELKLKETAFLESKPASIEEIQLVHTKEYVNDIINLKMTQRTMCSELPLTKEIINAFMISVGGTILASNIALKSHFAFHIGGGWHHAFPDKAEGFCYLNDVAVAVRKLQKKKQVKKISVIDCDLHQGNGTAFIFGDDPDVFTFSIHQENLYPIKQRSKLDIGLSDFADDSEYLRGLARGINEAVNNFKPEVVFYLAGADPYKEDQLGTLQITMDGLKKRDEMIIEACVKSNIPIIIALAGGYARETEDTVNIHLNTAKVMMEYVC